MEDSPEQKVSGKRGGPMATGEVPSSNIDTPHNRS
jgi:hypothetical protein